MRAITLICLLSGLAAIGTPARGGAPELEVLHVLIVADTLDGDIGPSVRCDADNVEAFLLAGIPKSRCRITVFTAEQVKRQNIINYYSALRPGPNEGLLFYFAGHGAMPNPQTKEHVLVLHKEAMLRTDVVRAMRATGSKLVVVLTDCCSTYPKRRNVGGTHEAITKKRTDAMAPGYRQLLFRPWGLVDVTAADDGEDALCNAQGGFFTRAFQLTLSQHSSRDDVTWRSFYPKLKENVSALAKNAKGIQTSRAFHLPGGTWGFVVDSRMRISEVFFDSPAERAGVRVGETLLKVNDALVPTKERCLQAMDQAKGATTLRLLLRDQNNGQVERVLTRVD